jgi:hypothetical protein
MPNRTRPDFRGTHAEHLRDVARLHLAHAFDKLSDLAVLVRDDGDREAVTDASLGIQTVNRALDDIGAEDPPDGEPETRCPTCAAILAHTTPGASCVWCALSERHLI